MSNRIQKLLEQLDKDDSNSSDEIRLRANHRSGIRCLECGRMLLHVHSLPAVRTCPNAECGSTFHLSRKDRGLGVRRVM